MSNGPQFQAPRPNEPGHFVPPQQPPAPAPKGKRFGWLAASMFALGGLVVGGVVFSGDPAPAADPAPAVTVTAKGEQVTVTEKPEPAPTVTVTAKAPEPKKDTSSATLTDGMFEVGSGDPEKVAPGRYKTVDKVEDVSAYGCYVDATDAAGDEYYAQEVADTGYVIVTIPAKADIVTVRDCGDFKKIA